MDKASLLAYQIATSQAGKVAEATSKANEAIEIAKGVSNQRLVYTAAEFGIVGDGTDQTSKLQTMIRQFSGSNQKVTIVFSRFEIYTISGRVFHDGKIEFEDANFIINNNNAGFNFLGDSPEWTNVTVNAGPYGHSTMGLVELVNTNHARFTKVRIYSRSIAKAFLCRGIANDTFIDDMEIQAAWGILFNDSNKEQGADYRKVQIHEDGTIRDFASDAMGKGLYVQKFHFYRVTSSGGDERPGDAFEINTPDHWFFDIQVSDSFVHGTYRSNKASATPGSNGIGFGFAYTWDVTLTNCFVRDSEHDGIHFEKGGRHTIMGCNVRGSERGYSISHTMSTKVLYNHFTDCGSWGVSYNNVVLGGVAQPTQYDLILEGNTFNGNKANPIQPGYGIILYNARNVRIVGNTFYGFAGTASTPSIILFGNTPNNLGGVTFATISGNTFDQGASTTTVSRIINFNGTTVVNCRYTDDNNVFGTSASGYTDANISTGVSQNEVSYRITATQPPLGTTQTAIPIKYAGGIVYNYRDPVIGASNNITPRVGLRCLNYNTNHLWICKDVSGTLTWVDTNATV